ncbi:MAG: hypothetical protein K6U74_13755 [Firmicutes bacterium]|nr:hypothetical protein [Bacillota bacterium]
MIYNPYFIYRKQVFERNYPGKKNKEEARDEKPEAVNSAEDGDLKHTTDAVAEKPLENRAGDGNSKHIADNGADVPEAVKQDDPTREEATNKRDDPTREEAIDKPAEKMDPPGFKQIAPGAYHFKFPLRTQPVVLSPPGCFPPALEQRASQQQDVPNRKTTETGFVRVDSFPGVYNNWGTPVYQFT